MDNKDYALLMNNPNLQGYGEEIMTPLLTQLTPEQLESIIKWQFNPDEIIDNFYHELLGEVKVKENKWVKKFEPLINEKGAKAVITVLRPHLSRVLSLSYFQKDEVNRIMREFTITLTQKLFVNMKKYDLTIDNANVIIHSAEHLVLGVLNGALNGGNRNLLSRGVRHVETIQQKPEGTSGFRIPYLSNLFQR